MDELKERVKTLWKVYNDEPTQRLRQAIFYI